MSQIEVEEILNSIKSENELQSEMFSKKMEEINTKLESITQDDGGIEQIKSSLKDLEESLESRYRNNLEKFESIKGSIENLSQSQELLTKNSDLKILFDVLTENVNNFAEDIAEQKNAIDDIENKLIELQNDHSRKDEIIEKVAIVKEGIDEVNRGLQASIMEVNSSLRGITKTLMTMDVTDQNDIIKRELENIYLATTGILSTLEIADQKNDDLAKNILVKDDLINLAGKIDNSFALVSEKIQEMDKSGEIISQIQQNREELVSFNENISKGLSDYLNSVRDVLSNCIEEIRQTQVNTTLESDSVARQKFENLEKLSEDIKKIDTTISNQSESYVKLISEKVKELGVSIDDFKSYIDKSNSGIGDKLDSKIGALDDFVVKFKEVFENKFGELQEKVDGSIQFIESFASDSSIKLGNSLSEIVDMKNEISRILDNMTAFNSHQEANISRLDGKLDGDLVDLKNDLNSFCTSFEALKYTLEQSNIDNREILSEIVENATGKTKEILDGLKNSNTEDVKNLTAQIDALKNQITDLNNTFTSVSAQNVGNILQNMENSISSINSLKEDISTSLENNFNDLKDYISSSDNDSKQNISEIGDKILNNTSQIAENIIENLKTSQNDLRNLKSEIPTILENDFQLLKDKISATTTELFQKIDNLDGNISNTSAQNFENLLTNIQSNGNKISELNNEISVNLDKGIQNIQEKISLSDIENKKYLSELEDKFITSTVQSADNIVSGIETISDRMNRIGIDVATELNNNSETIREILSSAGSETSQKIEDYGEKLITITHQNAANLLSELNSTSSKIDMLGVDLSTEIDNNFDMVRDFIEYSKSEKIQNINELNTLSENIKKIESDFSANTQQFKVAIDEHLLSLQDYFNALQNSRNSNEDKAQFEKLAEKMLSVETAMHEAGDNFSDNLMMLQNKIADYINSVDNISELTTQKLDLSLNEISSVKSELQNIIEDISSTKDLTGEKIEEITKSLIVKFDDIASNIVDIKGNVSSDVNNSLKQNTLMIEEKITALQELLNDNNLRSFDTLNDLYENLNVKLESLKQEVGLIHTDVSDVIASKADVVLEEFLPLKDSIENFINTDFDKIIDSIKSQIELSYLSFSADVNENLNENHDSYVQLEEAYKVLIEKFSNIENIISDLTENQIGILTTAIKETEQNFSQGMEKNASLLDEWKADLKLLESKIENTTSDSSVKIVSQLVEFIKNNSAVNKKDIQEYISLLIESGISGDDLSEQLTNLKQELLLDNRQTKESIQTIQENIASLNSKVDVLAMSDTSENIEYLIDTLQEKISKLTEKDQNKEIEELLHTMQDKLDILVFSADDIKLDNIQSILQSLNAKVEELSKGNIIEEDEIIQALHDKLDLLVTSDDSERMEEMVQALHDKVDVLVTSDDNERMEEMVQALHDKVDVLVTSDDNEKMEEMIQSLHNKIDALKSENKDEKFEELTTLINTKINNNPAKDNEEKIEKLVQALHEKIDILASSDESEIIEEIQEIKELISEQRKQIESLNHTERSIDIDKHLQELLTDLSNIEKRLTGLDLEKNASDIKDSVMNAVLSVADQITFVEETEEIKDFVEERTHEINKNLLDVKKQLNNITNGTDEWDYSYTMQDIESDIAKLRLILSDISSTATSKDDITEISQNMHKIASSINSLHSTLTEEQILELKTNVEKINEDVLSLSSRTNKLLLTSDESYRALTDGLDDFSRVAANLQKRIDELENNGLNEIVVNKLDNIADSVQSSANSDNIMRKAMMYMGEWIDEASEKLDTIATDVSNVSIISSEICLLKSMVDNTAILDSLENKFNAQQNRIEKLENKLDELINVIENQKKEENSLNLEQKLDKLNDKITKLSEGLEKLASYVDED